MNGNAGAAPGRVWIRGARVRSQIFDPRALRAHYQAFFEGAGSTARWSADATTHPLTGHSHQAWPDVAEAAMLSAFRDAALHVDDKWEAVFRIRDAVTAAIIGRIGGQREEYTFAGSTHELLVRFLSSLDLSRRRHIVTTSGEFHSAHRQLRRLAEEGIDVTWVDPSHSPACCRAL